jgi:Asp-tRNA(Asn)/Glu-tRNA(Gln) amidotransferase A subunit family amidase
MEAKSLETKLFMYIMIFRQETRNNLIGQTNNPYDLRRTVGGSSGGEGALISSCGSCFGLGDIIYLKYFFV